MSQRPEQCPRCGGALKQFHSPMGPFVVPYIVSEVAMWIVFGVLATVLYAFEAAGEFIAIVLAVAFGLWLFMRMYLPENKRRVESEAQYVCANCSSKYVGDGLQPLKAPTR